MTAERKPSEAGMSMVALIAGMSIMFIMMGAAVPARHRTAWIALFAMLQGFVAVMFFTWRPLY